MILEKAMVTCLASSNVFTSSKSCRGEQITTSHHDSSWTYKVHSSCEADGNEGRGCNALGLRVKVNGAGAQV